MGRRPVVGPTSFGGEGLERRQVLFVIRRRTPERTLLSALQDDYDVHVARGRREALMQDRPPDLIILHLPSVRFDLHRFVEDSRARWPDVLLLYLLGRKGEADGHPPPDEMLAPPLTPRRLRNVLTRLFSPHDAYVLRWEGLCLGMTSHTLCWDGREVRLTPRQAALMAAFLRAPERLLQRAWLMQEVWGTDYVGNTRTMDVHIHWLRRALRKLEAPFVLETRRRYGYRLSRREETEPTAASR